MLPIAELKLSGLRADGRVVPITASVGQPYQAEHHWRCPVSLIGIDEHLPDIAGEDSLQALCLGLRLLGMRLADFLAKGGRLFGEGGGPEDPGTELPLDTYFGPLGGLAPPSLSEPDKVIDWSEWSRQAVAAMEASNKAWIEQYQLAGAPYHWDLAAGELVFTRAGDEVVADLCLVGTVSEMAGTFQWAWANDAIPAAAKRDLHKVRTFGATHGLPLLTTPERPGGRSDGLEMLAIAGRIQEASGGFIESEGELVLFFTLHRWRVRTGPGPGGGPAG